MLKSIFLLLLLPCFDCAHSLVIFYSYYRLPEPPLDSKVFCNLCNFMFSCNSLSSAEKEKDFVFLFLFVMKLNDCFSLEIIFSSFDLTLYLWLQHIFWLRFDWDSFCVES